MLENNKKQLYIQYDQHANTFSKLQAEYNKNSITDFYHTFPNDITGLKILDLGSGDGTDLSHVVARGAKGLGIDTSTEMLKLANQNYPDLEFMQSSFEAIPCADKSMNIVMSKWALQMAVNLDCVYQEIHRVLRDRGQLIYLATHPLRHYLEQNDEQRNYFAHKIVTSKFFNGQISVTEPSHTLEDFLSPLFFELFNLCHFKEGQGPSSDLLQDEVYPSYFIIKAKKK